MGTVNVNRSLTDQFYRYKMPKIIAKVEGKGNGIKTVIVNMVEVAKALNRPPSYTTKYFGFELGAQTQLDIKNERFIVNGAHDPCKLQVLLDGFIKRYVLCAACENPETVLSVVSKKGIITSTCKACGHNSQLDTKHKLSSFIIRNPPDQETGLNGTTGQLGKKGRKKSKEDKNAKKQVGDCDQSLHNESDHSLLDRESATTTDSLHDFPEDWAVETDAVSVAKRMANLTTGVQGLMHDSILEKPNIERLNLFFEYLKNLVSKSDETVSMLHFDDIFAEVKRLDVKEKAILVLCELLLNDKILPQIKQYRTLFLKFTYNNPKSQRYLLGGIEQVIEIHKDILLPRVSHILKAFYDHDILEEDMILEWSNKISKKYVSKEMAHQIHANSAAFIKWLREAEEEDSSEDSEDDEDKFEVVYTDRVKVPSLQKIEETQNYNCANSTLTDDIEDDLDIDAI